MALVAVKADRWAVFWAGRLVALTVRLVITLGFVYEYQERYFLLLKSSTGAKHLEPAVRFLTTPHF